MVLNAIQHEALPNQYLDQTVLIDLTNQNENLFDKFFKKSTDKTRSFSLPGSLDQQEFFKEQVCICDS